MRLWARGQLYDPRQQRDDPDDDTTDEAAAALVSTVGGWLGIGGASAATTGATLGGTAIGGSAGIGSGTVLGGGAATAGSSASMAGFAGVPVIGWIAAGMMASASAYDQGNRWDGKYEALDPAMSWNDGGLKALGMSGRNASIITGSALSQQFLDVFFGNKVEFKSNSLVAQAKAGGVSSVADYTELEQTSGVFGGGKTTNGQWKDANAGVSKYFDDMVKGATAGAKAYAAAIGLSADAVDGFAQEIKVDITGLDPAKQKEAIDKAVGGFFNDMVTSAYSQNVTAFAHAGETTAQTIQRLGSDLVFVNGGLEMLGYNAMSASLASASAASGLVDAAGGTDKLQASVGYYYEHFRSDSEKAAYGVASLSESFAAIGYKTVPTTKAGFDALIDGLDLTTTAGQTAAAGLFALAPAFDSVANSALAAANKMLSALVDYGTTDEVRDFQVEMIRKGLADGGVSLSHDQIANATRADARALYEQRVAAGDQRGADAILDQAKAFASITQVKQQAQMVGSSGGGGGGGGGGSSAADSVKSALQQYTDAIFGEVKRIRGLLEGDGEEAYAAAKMRLVLANASAQAGSTEALKALPELSQNVLALAESNESTYLDLQRIRGQTAAMLAATGTQVATQNGLTIPAFAGGGNHAGGWAMVGELGPELAYLPPARIYTASDTRSMTAGGSGGGNVGQAMALNAMAEQLEVIAANTESSALSAARAVRMLEHVIPEDDEDVIAVKVVVPKGESIPVSVV